MPLELSLNDLLRVKQCINCEYHPADCGCTEDDEDENGFCKKYKRRKTNENNKCNA